MVGNEGGKPADVVPGGFQIGRGPNGGGGHYLELAEVAAGFFGALADKAEAPIDEIGVGKLQDYAIAYSSCRAQGFRAVAGNPNRWDLVAGPGKICGHAVEVHRFAGV